MEQLVLDDANTLAYVAAPPERAGAPSFVFVNALTGDTGAWEAAVAPALRQAGFGTISYNLRGQEGSRFAPDLALTDAVIVADLRRLIDGGPYAAKAVLAGQAAAGLVLLNTLRVIGPRIAWVNDAMTKLVAHGGVGLFLDALFPLLVNEEKVAQARPNFLKGPYEPLDPAHGHMNLMRHAAETDWAIDWSALALPVLSITGLEDRVFLNRAVVDRLYAKLPDARREDWADAGHLLPQERPERLADSLARFGSEIEAAGGRL